MPLKNTLNDSNVDNGVTFIQFLWEQCKPELEKFSQKEIDIIANAVSSISDRINIHRDKYTGQDELDHIFAQTAFSLFTQAGEIRSKQEEKEYREKIILVLDDMKRHSKATNSKITMLLGDRGSKELDEYIKETLER